MNGKAAKDWLSINEGAMKGWQQVHFIARLKDEVVGIAALSVSTYSAGIWNLATRPEHRKEGVGASLVHVALIEAKKQEHDLFNGKSGARGPGVRLCIAASIAKLLLITEAIITEEEQEKPAAAPMCAGDVDY